MYSIVTEQVNGVFATDKIQYWYKILGPYGLSFQAYLNEETANKIVEEKNKQTYFNPKEFCDNIRKRLDDLNR